MPKIPAKTIVVPSTPIEKYNGVYVKRDDLCCNDPGLAKIRGIWKFVSSRPSFQTFGVLDGRHSKNGWALARVCIELGKSSVVFWPKRVSDSEEDEGPTRENARRLGARVEAIPAGRSAVVFSQAKKLLPEVDKNSIMLPNAVKIRETVDAHIQEIQSCERDMRKIGFKSVVVPVGTGTIFSGVLSGLFRLGLVAQAYGILGYSQNEVRLRNYLSKFTSFPQESIHLIDSGFAYGKSTGAPAPFPACEYYEAVAWNWLLNNQDQLPKPILFWNSGD